MIIGITTKEYFQIGLYNLNAIEGNLIESIQNSNIFKTNSFVYWKMSLVNFKTFKSILPRLIIKPDSSKDIFNY